MMKLVSLIAFVAAFIWTWFMFNSVQNVGIDIHAGIQSKLSVLIIDTIADKKKTAKDIEILKMSTKKIDDNKMSAQFSYRYTDAVIENEVSTQTFNGEAILTRGLSENPQVQKWIVQSIKSNADQIEFREGFVIDANTPSEEAPPKE